MKLIGLCRLGRDAEIKYTDSGDPVANFSAAFDVGVKDSDGKRQSQWVKLALFGKRAEKLAGYLTKGKQLFIVAKDVQVRTFDKRGGGTGVELRANVDDLEFAGPKDADAAQSPAKHESAPHPYKQGIAGLDDDIPL